MTNALTELADRLAAEANAVVKADTDRWDVNERLLQIANELRTAASGVCDPGAEARDAVDAERYRWLRTPPNNINPNIYAACNLLMRDGYLDDAIDAQLAKRDAALRALEATDPQQ